MQPVTRRVRFDTRCDVRARGRGGGVARPAPLWRSSRNAPGVPMPATPRQRPSSGWHRSSGGRARRSRVRVRCGWNHVCTKHDMTQQHIASSLPAGSLTSGDRRRTPPARRCRPRSRQRPRGRRVCPLPAGLLVSVAAHSAATPERAQRAIFPPRWVGGGLAHQPAPLCSPGPFSRGRSAWTTGCRETGRLVHQRRRRSHRSERAKAASVRLPTTRADAASTTSRGRSVGSGRPPGPGTTRRKPCDQVLPVLGAQSNIVQHMRTLPRPGRGRGGRDGADVGVGGADRPAGDMEYQRIGLGSTRGRHRWPSRPGRPPGCELQVHQVAGPGCGVAAGIGAGDGLAWPWSAFPGAAGEQAPRRSSSGTQRRFPGLSTGRRRSRLSGRPTRSHGPRTALLLSAAEPR